MLYIYTRENTATVNASGVQAETDLVVVKLHFFTVLYNYSYGI